jgi:hypothetical protein
MVSSRNNLIGYLVLTDSTSPATRRATRDATLDDQRRRQAAAGRAPDVMIARLQREGVRADVVKSIATTTFRSSRSASPSAGGPALGRARRHRRGVPLFMSIVFHGQNVWEVWSRRNRRGSPRS